MAKVSCCPPEAAGSPPPAAVAPPRGKETFTVVPGLVAAMERYAPMPAKFGEVRLRGATTR
jgi:hypothetical protein